MKPHVRLKLPGSSRPLRGIANGGASSRYARAPISSDRASRLGDGPLSDMRAFLAREEAVEEAQGVNAGSSLVRDMAAHQPGSGSRGRPFSARAGGGGREADAPPASLYLKGLTANSEGGCSLSAFLDRSIRLPSEE